MPFPISCSSCDARYLIPEALFHSRFAGRETTIKCKRCRSIIAVDGRQSAASDTGSSELDTGSAPSAPASARRPSARPWLGLRSISLRPTETLPPPQEWTSFESVAPESVAPSRSELGGVGLTSEQPRTVSGTSLRAVVLPAEVGLRSEPAPPDDAKADVAMGGEQPRVGEAPAQEVERTTGVRSEQSTHRTNRSDRRSAGWFGVAAAVGFVALWIGAGDKSGPEERRTKLPAAHGTDPGAELDDASARPRPTLEELQALLALELRRVRGCWRDQPAIEGTELWITFTPAGRVSSVRVDADSKLSSVSTCIQSHLLELRIPPFHGSELRVPAKLMAK